MKVASVMQFAKLFLAALVFALGVVACSGGGGGSSGGGGGGGDNDDNGDLAGIVPATFALSVTTFSVSSSSIVAGEAITLSATVGNAASATTFSSAATLRYYRSSDATIDSTADTEVGTADSIGALAPETTKTETATDSPTVAGTYYYGACVDGGTPICSAGVQVDVAARDFDLSVTAFSVAPSSVVAGNDITFSATVGNGASAMHSSPVAELKYYRSPDITITSSDIEVVTDSIDALAAAATKTETATTIPTIAGDYYYGVCVVAAGDSNSGNDCSTGVRVRVAGQGFDLSIAAFVVSSSSVPTNEPITFTATVGNDSSASAFSSAATLKYYRSSDTTITSSDTEVGTADSISALAPAATSAQTAIDIPSTVGTYYYGACVASTGDSDTSNDCSAAVQVVVVARDFDLSVTAFSVSDSSLIVDNSITLNATVGNASSAMHPSLAAGLKYYRSSDATITSADTEVGVADSLSALAPAATKAETAIDIPSTVGTYYYGACVIAAGDSDTSNDCSAAVQVVVVAREFDLSVTTFSVSDSSVLTNEPITFTATVGNHALATVSSPVATLKYYRSTDATITSSDTEVGATDSISALAVAATETETAIDIPTVAGTYYYGACVVAAGDSVTSNDCSAGVQVVVTARDFDLSVTAFSVIDSSVVTGSGISLTTTVSNDASSTHSSPGFSLRYYLSSNAIITSSDTIVHTDSLITAVAAGATRGYRRNLSSQTTVGTYYYGVCIVAPGDSDASNDCSAGVRVVVTDLGFDLSVTAFSVSDTSVSINDPITFTATFSNDSSATQSSSNSAVLYFYRSTDATITSSAQLVTTEHIRDELAAGATETATNIAFARSPAGTYYYGACIREDGDSDFSNNCSAGVQVVVAGGEFDLSVTAFSVSPLSVRTNAPITFSTTIRNASSATINSGRPSVHLYRSTDSIIDTTDISVGRAAYSSDVRVAAGATASLTITHYRASSTAGTFYYGACADVTGDSDTTNDCSTGVRVEVTASSR